MIIKKYGKIDSVKPRLKKAKCPECGTVVQLDEGDLTTHAESQYWTCPFCTRYVRYDEFISVMQTILYILAIVLLPIAILVSIGKWSVDAIHEEHRNRGTLAVVCEVILLALLIWGLIVISWSTILWMR